ncbi:unnamed protein product [Agarophyton chilense]
MDSVKNKGILPNFYIKRFRLLRVSAVTGAGEVDARAASEMLVEDSGDFPVVAAQKRENRFLYTTKSSEGVMAGLLQKYDLQTGERRVFRMPGCIMGEMQFVGDPSGKAEDDGCLIGVALDTVDRRSILVVLDARQVCEIARAELPVAVPSGLHSHVRNA